ncbi:hypothetical protein PLICRDRAFT_169996 [Plicaturopsis crispa FD-325 SS-3]|nr:hypothetical protein PLICRDRAFT_169996 [Plicaturopsis crispa FD-325 SS-3]
MTKKNKQFSPQAGAFPRPKPYFQRPVYSQIFTPPPEMAPPPPPPPPPLPPRYRSQVPTPSPSEGHSSGGSNDNAVTSDIEELRLLDDDSSDQIGDSRDHEMRTAPLMTRDAFIAAGYPGTATQYGVMGKVLSVYSGQEREETRDPRLYVNTNAPFSAIVCGVQGSGKSHTVSTLLENMFIPNFPQIGSLQKPLSGLVLHFGEGGPSSRPSEAAWVGVSNAQRIQAPPVRVYVSRSSLNTMKAVYAPLGPNITVEPLLFTEAELDAEAFLSMMAVGSSDSAPLYIQVILSLLRDLGEKFTYQAFTQQLEIKKRDFNPAQSAGLEQRMALLTAFMDKTKRGNNSAAPSRFCPGQLTIIDLSDPFIDPASACGLFEIITRLFVRADVGTGKVLLVDEAHKYLSANKGSSGLTKSLLTLTREQRHLAMRVIISTQEPTVVPPVLLDLCTVAILHRFSSPAWWEHLSKHVSADLSADDAFDKVVKLKTGEAIILAPSGLGVLTDKTPGAPQSKTLAQFGRRYLLVKTRRRITADGGASVLVLD